MKNILIYFSLVLSIIAISIGGYLLFKIQSTPIQNDQRVIVPTNTTSSITPSSSTTLKKCSADDLALSINPQQGAAGTIVYTLTFINRSNSACTLFGYPGVQLLSDSKPLGNPATRNPSINPQTITLESGQEAIANLGVPNHDNYPSEVCTGPSTSLGVIPPDTTTQLTIPFSQYYCPGFSVSAIYRQ